MTNQKRHQRIFPKKRFQSVLDFPEILTRHCRQFFMHMIHTWFNFLRFVNKLSIERSFTAGHTAQIQLILILCPVQLIKNRGFAIYWPLNNIDRRRQPIEPASYQGGSRLSSPERALWLHETDCIGRSSPRHAESSGEYPQTRGFVYICCVFN
jgi:hypothetical protein